MPSSPDARRVAHGSAGAIAATVGCGRGGARDQQSAYLRDLEFGRNSRPARCDGRQQPAPSLRRRSHGRRFTSRSHRPRFTCVLRAPATGADALPAEPGHEFCSRVDAQSDSSPGATRGRLSADPKQRLKTGGSASVDHLLMNACQAITEVTWTHTSSASASGTRRPGSSPRSGQRRGIEPESCALFEPFFTTRMVGEGSGLALSCLLPSSRVGGTIEVRSGLGRARRFREAARRRARKPTRPRCRRSLHRHCAATALLVIDDEPPVGRAVARYLGSTSHVESRAKAALQRCARASNST